MTDPPGGYAARAPREDDAAAVAELLVAAQRADFGEEEAHAQEVAADWRVLDLERDAVLALDPTGRVAAYGYFFRRAERQAIIDGYVHPSHEGQGLGAWVLGEFERRARELTADGPLRLGTGIAASNERARRLVDSMGYRVVRRFWRMAIELDGPREPAWPKGVRPVPLSSVGDRAVWEAVEEAFRDHWEYQPEPYGEWLRHMVEHEAFDPDLWIVAQGDDGVAGVAINRRHPQFGRIETLAVRRPWRRRGVGRALVEASLHALHERGERSVVLNVDAENLTGATQLYQQAGMTVVREIHAYEKLLGRIAGTR